MAEGAQEQHFILRVQDAELASKLRGWLRDSDKPSDKISEIRLLFEQPDDRRGVLTVNGVQHEVWLQDLPAVVESYKTLDDANLVKITDIGQVLVVVDPAVNKETDYAAKDGVTPPMRNAALRQFKPPINAPQERMHDVFTDVMEMLNGRAPEGYSFQDYEEECVVDANGHTEWRQVKPGKQQRGAAAAAAAAAGGEGAARAPARGRGRRKAANDSDLEDYEGTDSD